jgi:hypothetical protein
VIQGRDEPASAFKEGRACYSSVCGHKQSMIKNVVNFNPFLRDVKRPGVFSFCSTSSFIHWATRCRRESGCLTQLVPLCEPRELFP